MKVITRGTALIGLAISSWLPATTGATTVTVEPPSAAAQVAELVAFDIQIAGSVDIFAFEFDLVFDPSILMAVSVIEGPFLPGGGATVFIPGTIDDGVVTGVSSTLLSAVPGVAGNGVLATVNFQAVGAGTSTISVSNSLFLDSGLADVLVDTNDASVRVGTVPAPASVLLLATGTLVALIYAGRHRLWT